MNNMLEEKEGRLILSTPYSANFVSDLKQSISDKKWDASTKTWICSINDKEIIESLLSKHYGYISDSNESITIKIRAKKDLSKLQDSVRFNGFPVARAIGRDSGARVCENVSLISGKIDSGGSMKNWTTTIKENSVFSITIPGGIKIEETDNWEIINENKKEALLKEKEILLKKIAEIDIELNNLV